MGEALTENGARAGGGRMNADESYILINGHRCRVWRKGNGRPIAYFPGIGGLPKWIPFLDHLATKRRVIAPSLPGYPGAAGFDTLDTHLDWLLAVHDLLVGAGAKGADLIASSVSGALAADVAGLWPELVDRLILIAPFGLFDPADPPADIWAQRPGHLNSLLTVEAQVYKTFTAQPDDADPIEWKVEQMRALEASARFLFPTGNTGLAARLGRISAKTLLMWGELDRVMPFSYAARFKQGLPSAAVIRIPDAGHLAELDAPAAVADAVLAFLG
ncbi:MAG: alpha/beta fold hydrolase [Gammaproteobacteria bacterium]